MAMYERGVQVTSGQGASIERAAQLVVFLGSDACGKLSGRLIRAFADRFEDFPAQADSIMSSEAYLMRPGRPRQSFPHLSIIPNAAGFRAIAICNARFSGGQQWKPPSMEQNQGWRHCRKFVVTVGPAAITMSTTKLNHIANVNPI